jgi:gliding motility-associated-like protein
VLPTISLNGISGTWNPSLVNTAVKGTQQYTFTPASGQCATDVTISIEITETGIVPIFDAIGPLCMLTQAPPLPGTSVNGITGTWSPSVINTGTVGITSYTFIPVSGQCAATSVLPVEITGVSITPTFEHIESLCENAPAPILRSTSDNEIVGTWSPSIVSTASTGIHTYTFTPAAGQCASPVSLNIQVNEAYLTPIFDLPEQICINVSAPILSYMSNNGITGIWSPSGINTLAPGSSEYTFVPIAGQCAVTVTRNVLVTSGPVVDLGEDVSICTPDYVVFDAGNEGNKFLWSNDNTGQTYTAYEGEGEVWVTVTDAYGCTSTDTILVLACQLMDHLLIPNAFTPNDDGDNDLWRIGGSQFYPLMHVVVFDRWGRMVFDSEPGYPKPWNGNLNHKELPMDAYYYIINLGNGREELRGSVTIIK